MVPAGLGPRGRARRLPSAPRGSGWEEVPGPPGRGAARATGREQTHRTSLYIIGKDSCNLMASGKAMPVLRTAKSIPMQHAGI